MTQSLGFCRPHGRPGWGSWAPGLGLASPVLLWPFGKCAGMDEGFPFSHRCHSDFQINKLVFKIDSGLVHKLYPTGRG